MCCVYVCAYTRTFTHCCSIPEFHANSGSSLNHELDPGTYAIAFDVRCLQDLLMTLTCAS